MLSCSNLQASLENREKISITSSHYLKKCNTAFIVVTLMTVLLDVFIVFVFGKSFLTLGLVAIVSLLPFTLITYLRKYIKSTYMKGETLIFRSFDKSSKVTSLRSVRKVRTKSVMGLQWTRLDYKLDGISNSVLIVNPASKKVSSPEVILNEAIDWSKKRKANHKPGSVAV